MEARQVLRVKAELQEPGSLRCYLARSCAQGREAWVAVLAWALGDVRARLLSISPGGIGVGWSETRDDCRPEYNPKQQQHATSTLISFQKWFCVNLELSGWREYGNLTYRDFFSFKKLCIFYC